MKANYFLDFEGRFCNYIEQMDEKYKIFEYLFDLASSLHSQLYFQKSLFFAKFDYSQFSTNLKEIGYLKDEGQDFKIETNNVDDEITKIAGPQLVVPIMNARYTLNAANARWVSLYDSLYGTNIIESEEGGSERYDPNRGQ